MEQNTSIPRRHFLQRVSMDVGAGMVAAGGISTHPASAISVPPVDKRNRLPREVWVASVSLYGFEGNTTEERIENLINRMDEFISCRPDIICHSELLNSTGVRNAPSYRELAETPPGPVIKVFAEYAKKHHCYIICPIVTGHGDKIYNTSVVLDRAGNILGEYHKIRPTVGEMKAGISPGPNRPTVFKTDFGTIGLQICFDLNWHDQWQDLKQAGAEIVFWSSQYCGGRLLNAEAWMNRYYVVSSTRRTPSKIIDISGSDLYASNSDTPWVCTPVNLEKAIVGRWPDVKKIKDIRRKYGRDLSITIYNEDERMIFESLSPDVRVADVLEEFEISVIDEKLAEAEAIHEKYWQGL